MGMSWLFGDDERTESDHDRDVSWLASTWSSGQPGFFSREETADRLEDDEQEPSGSWWSLW